MENPEDNGNQPTDDKQDNNADYEDLMNKIKQINPNAKVKIKTMNL